MPRVNTGGPLAAQHQLVDFIRLSLRSCFVTRLGGRRSWKHNGVRRATPGRVVGARSTRGSSIFRNELPALVPVEVESAPSVRLGTARLSLTLTLRARPSRRDAGINGLAQGAFDDTEFIIRGETIKLTAE